MLNVSLRMLAFAAAMGVVAPPPARAAVALEPGLWEDTETAMVNGRSTAPETATTCLSPEEARDPVKTILQDTEGQTCETRDIKESGGTVMATLKCSDSSQTRMEIEMTINVLSQRHYTGTMKSMVIFRGQRLASERTIDSKWIAASCTK